MTNRKRVRQQNDDDAALKKSMWSAVMVETRCANMMTNQKVVREQNDDDAATKSQCGVQFWLKLGASKQTRHSKNDQ